MNIPGWSNESIEAILRQARTPNSFTITGSWCIGRRDEESPWRVFYRGICAWYRLNGRNEQSDGGHATFHDAYEWMRNLTREQIRTITGE